MQHSALITLFRDLQCSAILKAAKPPVQLHEVSHVLCPRTPVVLFLKAHKLLLQINFGLLNFGT